MVLLSSLYLLFRPRNAGHKVEEKGYWLIEPIYVTEDEGSYWWRTIYNICKSPEKAFWTIFWQCWDHSGSYGASLVSLSSLPAEKSTTQGWRKNDIFIRKWRFSFFSKNFSSRRASECWNMTNHSIADPMVLLSFLYLLFRLRTAPDKVVGIDIFT